MCIDNSLVFKIKLSLIATNVKSILSYCIPMPMEVLHMEKSWFAFLFNSGKLKGLSKLTLWGK